MDELIAWIILSRALSPGGTSFGKLIRAFGTAGEILSATDGEIARVISSGSEDYAHLVRRDVADAEKILAACREKRIGILPYTDEKYPEAFRRLTDPPAVLYTYGKLPDLNADFFVSAVGTRMASEYGMTNAFAICRDLARAGAVIVSGLAIGIDAASLAGGVSADAPTVGILGSGIDRLYPKENRTLAVAMLHKGGCLLSEYAPGTPAMPYHFPTRNRLISALSPATLLIEGGERSGSLITANLAKKQGRKVYALPGSVGSGNAAAPNMLLRDGAHILTSASDVLTDFADAYVAKVNPFVLRTSAPVNRDAVFATLGITGYHTKKSPARRQTKAPRVPPKETVIPPPAVPAPGTLARLTPVQRAVYDRLPAVGDVALDALVDGELTSKDILRALPVLEMLGLSELLPGERIRRRA